MKKLLLFIILNSAFLIFNSFCFAQNKNTSGERSRTIDSLLILIKTDKPDTNKVIHLNKLCGTYTNIGRYDTALYYGNAALRLSQQLYFKKGIANSYSKIGIVYYYQADYPKTLECWLKALKICEELKDKIGIARHLDNIGGIYYSQSYYFKALNYFLKALKINEELGVKSGIANSLGNIGLVYFDKTDYPEALDYFLKALKIKEEIGDKNSIALTIANIGAVYGKQGYYPKAIDYFFNALKINEGLGDKNQIAYNLSSIGSLYTSIGKFKEAEKYYNRAIAINDSIGSVDNLRQVEEAISQLYDTTRQYKLALIHYKKAIALKDSIFSQENKKQLVRKEMSFEFDKKEAATKAANDKQIAIEETEKKQQQIVIWSVAFGLVLVMIFAGFIFRSLHLTRKQKNIIEQQRNEVSKQKNEVTNQKEEAEKQKDIANSQRIIAEGLRLIAEKQKHIVEEKQKEIVDSITYARRIQRALLTSDEYITNNFTAALSKGEGGASDYFILFKPKDIVSGDFYWALRSPPPSGETGRGVFYIATADCTGHGVPGAFMSMLNISYLNENVIERGIRMPHDVLNAQRAEIIKALNPIGSTEVSNDGMDCILCVYDLDKKLLHFAAANNPLWLMRNGKLTEYKGDKMPVGKHTEDMHPFTLQTIELRKGDIIYTSTDGYADQFGTNGKKLMKKKFKEELVKIHQQPMAEQKEYLNQFFENWKGNTEQVDDVTVIGIRI